MNLSAYKNIERKNKKCILYLHTYSGNKCEGKFIFQYLPAHFDLALFDFPGCGNSKAKYVTYGLTEKYDLDSILRKLEAEAGYKEFYLWGRSMGAAVAILYSNLFLYPKKSKKKKNKKKKKLKTDEKDLKINEITQRGWKDKIKFLVIDSAFTNLFEMLQGKLNNKRYAQKQEWNPQICKLLCFIFD